MINLAFSPSMQALTYLSATATSAVTQLQGSATQNNSIEIYNRGSAEVFLMFGDNPSITAVAATNNGGYAVGAGQRIVITRPIDSVNGWQYVAAVCAATQTTNVMLALGIGN